MVKGDFVWHELMTRDAEQAGAFYKALLGWEMTVSPLPEHGGYILFKRDGREHAGMMAMQGPEFEGVPASWMIYIQVEDCDKAAEAVAANGGTVMRPPFDIPEAGRIAVVADPGGAVFGIMTPAMG